MVKVGADNPQLRCKVACAAPALAKRRLRPCPKTITFQFVRKRWQTTKTSRIEKEEEEGTERSVLGMPSGHAVSSASSAVVTTLLCRWQSLSVFLRSIVDDDEGDRDRDPGTIMADCLLFVGWQRSCHVMPSQFGSVLSHIYIHIFIYTFVSSLDTAAVKIFVHNADHSSVDGWCCFLVSTSL